MELKDRDGEAITQGIFGAAYNAASQYAKAAESLKQSLEIARELKSPERLREALNELARLASETRDISLKPQRILNRL